MAGGQRRYTEGDDPRDHTDLLHRHLAALQERIDRATAAKELIEHGLACPVPFDECPDARRRIAAHIRG